MPNIYLEFQMDSSRPPSLANLPFELHLALLHHVSDPLDAAHLVIVLGYSLTEWKWWRRSVNKDGHEKIAEVVWDSQESRALVVLFNEAFRTKQIQEKELFASFFDSQLFVDSPVFAEYLSPTCKSFWTAVTSISNSSSTIPKPVHVHFLADKLSGIEITGKEGETTMFHKLLDNVNDSLAVFFDHAHFQDRYAQFLKLLLAACTLRHSESNSQMARLCMLSDIARRYTAQADLRLVCDAAVFAGRIDVLRWAQEKGFAWSTYLCDLAASRGFLEIFKFLHENDAFWNENTCRLAAWNGHLDILKYAHEHGCPWDAWTCKEAAEIGSLDILKYAHENGCPWNATTCSSAAKNGHLDILKYAHENCCPWNTYTTLYAAKYGHLAVLKYAHENGCPWNDIVCRNAAENNHLSILKYAHENACPWDSYTCKYAAMNGHLEVLKYAIENGCPWNENTFKNATEEVRHWLETRSPSTLMKR